jgi:hypothetical protein
MLAGNTLGLPSDIDQGSTQARLRRGRAKTGRVSRRRENSPGMVEASKVAFREGETWNFWWNLK